MPMADAIRNTSEALRPNYINPEVSLDGTVSADLVAGHVALSPSTISTSFLFSPEGYHQGDSLVWKDKDDSFVELFESRPLPSSPQVRAPQVLSVKVPPGHSHHETASRQLRPLLHPDTLLPIRQQPLQDSDAGRRSRVGQLISRFGSPVTSPCQSASPAGSHTSASPATSHSLTRQLDFLEHSCNGRDYKGPTDSILGSALTGLAHAAAAVQHDPHRIEHLANMSASPQPHSRHNHTLEDKSWHVPSRASSLSVPRKGRAVSSFDAADADQRAREWAFSTLRVIDSNMQVIEHYISSLEVVERAILGLMHKLAHHISFEARSSLMAKERRRLKQHKTMLMLGGWAERKRLRQVLAKAVRAWAEVLAESGWTQVLHVRAFDKSRLVLLVWKHVALLNSTGRQVLSSSLLGRMLRRTIGAAWGRWRYLARQAGAHRGKLASRAGQRRRKQLWCVWQCWLRARDQAWATAALEMRVSRKLKTTGRMRCAETFYAIVKCVLRRKWLRKAVIMMARRSASWRLSLLWQAWDGSRQQQRLRRQREDRLVTAIVIRRTVRYFAAWSSLVLRQRDRLRLAATLSRATAARHRAREAEVVRHAVALWRRLVSVGKGLRWRAAVCRRWRKKRFTHRWKTVVHGQGKRVLLECSASLHPDATPSWLLARVRLKRFGLQRQGVASWRSLVASSKMADLKIAFCLRGRRRRVFQDWQAAVGEVKEAKWRVQRVMAAWNKGQMRSKERFFGGWTSRYLRKRRLHRMCHRIGFQCSSRLAMGAFHTWMRYVEEMLEDKAEEQRRPHANTQMERNLVLAALQRWRGRLLALKRAEAKSAKAARHWQIRAQSLALRRLQHYCSCQRRLAAAARKILQRWRFLGVARALYTWRDCANARRLTDIAARKRRQRCLVHSLRVLKVQVSLAEDRRAIGANARGRWLQRQAQACLVSWCHLACRRQVLRKAGSKIMSRRKCLRLSAGIARWLEAVGESRRLQREASESRSQRLEGEVSTLSLLAASLEARMRRRLLMCTAWRVWWSCACRRRRIMIKVEAHVCLLTRRKLSRCVATFWQEVKRQQQVTLLMSRIEKRRDRRWCWYGLVGWVRHLGAARVAAAAEDSQARLQRKALQHALQQWAMLILAEHVQREERARYRHKSIVRMLRGSNEVKLKILSLNGQWLVPEAFSGWKLSVERSYKMQKIQEAREELARSRLLAWSTAFAACACFPTSS